MDVQIHECKRDNLCYECDDKKCWHAGQLIADCPLWRCNQEGDLFEDCKSCALLKQIHEKAANQESAEDVLGLYCDDITFCWGPCDRFKCPRNKYNIRDKRVPHSFFAEGVVPDDCPKKQLV